MNKKRSSSPESNLGSNFIKKIKSRTDSRPLTYQKNFIKMILGEIKDDCTSLESRNFYSTNENQCNYADPIHAAETPNHLYCCHSSEYNSPHLLPTYLQLINAFLNTESAILEFIRWEHLKTSDKSILPADRKQVYKNWYSKEAKLLEDLKMYIHAINLISSNPIKLNQFLSDFKLETKFIEHLSYYAFNLSKEANRLMDALTRTLNDANDYNPVHDNDNMLLIRLDQMEKNLLIIDEYLQNYLNI